MKLEMKSIKYFASGSEETSCYTAFVWMDGKKWAAVSNEGHGGPDRVDPVTSRSNGTFWNQVKEVSDSLAETPDGVAYLAKWTDPDAKYKLTYDLEAWCGDQLDNFLYTKDMRKAMKSHVLFMDEEDQLQQIGYTKARKQVDLSLIKQVQDQYPKARILNMMPDQAKALVLFKQGAGV